MFGKSSEQVNENQLCFFYEAEKNSDLKMAEPEIESISYSRKKDNTSNLKRVIIEHKLDDEKKTAVNVDNK